MWMALGVILRNRVHATFQNRLRHEEWAVALCIGGRGHVAVSPDLGASVN
jgi:hypothetical protein